jgi:hypothetical protein
MASSEMEQLPEYAKEWLEFMKMMQQQGDSRYKPMELIAEREESALLHMGDASVLSEDREDAMADAADYLRDAADGLEDDWS